MDIEQLKLILETLGAAGEGAFWFGILYLLDGFFVTTCTTGVVVFLVWMASRVVTAVTRSIDFCEEINSAMGYSESRWDGVLGSVRKRQKVLYYLKNRRE